MLSRSRIGAGEAQGVRRPIDALHLENNEVWVALHTSSYRWWSFFAVSLGLFVGGCVFAAQAINNFQQVVGRIHEQLLGYSYVPGYGPQTTITQYGIWGAVALILACGMVTVIAGYYWRSILNRHTVWWWICANVVGVTVMIGVWTGISYWFGLFQRRHDLGWIGMVLPTITMPMLAGAIVGGAQWLLLRRVIQKAYVWVLVLMLTWAVWYSIAMGIITLLFSDD